MECVPFHQDGQERVLCSLSGTMSNAGTKASEFLNEKSSSVLLLCPFVALCLIFE